MSAPINEDFLDSEIAHAKSMIVGWEHWALACSIMERDRISHEDLQRFDLARERIKIHFAEFALLADAIREHNPILAANLYGHTVAMIDASLTMGGTAMYSPNARKFYQAPFREEKRKAGEKSGEARREKRTWIEPFEKLVLDLRAKKSVGTEKPRHSYDDLATDASALWKGAEEELPGHATLKKHIAEMVKNGTLAPRKK